MDKDCGDYRCVRQKFNFTYSQMNHTRRILPQHCTKLNKIKVLGNNIKSTTLNAWMNFPFYIKYYKIIDFLYT